MTRVLVVEGGLQLVQALLVNLKAREYEVDAAPDGTTALRLAATRHPDVALVDLGLRDMDGLDVIRILRAWARIQILVVSVRQESGEKVKALDAGADDYITKPFAMDELLARLRAAVRRTEAARSTDGPADGPAIVTTGAFTIDLTAKKAHRGSHPIRLTPTEWRLLEILIRHSGQLVPQKRLLHDVWGPAQETRTNYLRVYMAQLRRKLEPDPTHPQHLITEPGMGYRFEQS